MDGALVRRNMLESWVRKLPLPFLERTLPGALLRLSVGAKAQRDGSTAVKYVIGRVRPRRRLSTGLVPHVLCVGPKT